MQNERSPHSEHAAEQTGLEDHVVARRRMAGFLGIGAGWLRVVQSSRANTKAAKSTSRTSSRSRSSVVDLVCELSAREARSCRLRSFLFAR